MTRLGASALVALAAACGGAPQGARAPEMDPELAEACRAFDPLTDLYAALESPAAFGASTDLVYLVQIDQELGYLEPARTSVAAGSAVGKELASLDAALRARRDAVASALAEVDASYEAAEEVLAATRPAFAKTTDAAARLWATARAVDLTSDVSASSVAAQLMELRLDSTRGPLRDRLASALKKHAALLEHFHALAAPKDVDEGSSPSWAALSETVATSLRKVSRACVGTMRESDRVVGGPAEPRRVTVVVRPKWTGKLAQLPHAEEFGSGFVVRWKNAQGKVETRIVTNNHVMDGAFEAEIAFEEEATRGKLTASLVRASPTDDVAVLRVDPGSEGAFGPGLAFRLAPAREEEEIVAAGFPGIGVKPSFQVSKGTVSNAKFGVEDPDASLLEAYIQHTAPIDPGNSGGPLLDATGHLLGMNTFKVVGRENVGLAIPASRIQIALLRAEERRAFGARLAEATCNAVVGALASSRPAPQAISRMGLALYDWAESRQGSVESARWRAVVEGQAHGQEVVDNPSEEARLRAYGSLRAAVEDDDGVRPFEACFDVRPKEHTPKEHSIGGNSIGGTSAGGTTGAYLAKFKTRTGTHELELAEEHGLLRVVAFE
jgi:S1-C subfamily serine protease